MGRKVDNERGGERSASFWFAESYEKLKAGVAHEGCPFSRGEKGVCWYRMWGR